MYSNSPEDDETSSPEASQSPTLSQRTKPGSYGKACDICRKKKARCNFEQPSCGYCRAFRHECTYNAAAACANRRNAKKLSIETKRQQRPPLPPTRAKSTGGSLMQPFSADPTSQSGYLTPVTPLDRRLHSAGATYHHPRASELLTSPINTGQRSNVYSPESTSPMTRTLSGHQEPNMSAMNGHGAPRYQPQHVRPYGQTPNHYLPEAARAILKAESDQRANAYMEMSYMDHQVVGKDHAGQAQLMQHTTSDPSHSFPHAELHHEEQIERVVSPASQSSMGQYPQYQGYDQYQHRVDMDPGVQQQQDPRHQIHQDWAPRRQSIPVPSQDERTMYRYHEVESQNTYSLR